MPADAISSDRVRAVITFDVTQNTEPPKKTGVCGAVSHFYGNFLTGWAMDLAQPDVRLAVEIYAGSAFIALCRADRFQPEADAEGLPGDAFHGFGGFIQNSLIEKAPYLAVRVANGGPWLSGQIELRPPVIEASEILDAEPNRREGEKDHKKTRPNRVCDAFVHTTGGFVLKGWALDPNDPHRHLRVHVRENGRIHATATANEPHPQLIDRVTQGQTADHGFSLALPWTLADGQPHQLVVEDETGRELPGSPVHFCAHPEGFLVALNRYWPAAAKTTPAFSALLRLAIEQDRRAPCSLSFSAYPEWLALTLNAAAPKNPLARVTTPPVVGALVLHPPQRHSTAFEQTRRSLQKPPFKTLRMVSTPFTAASIGVRALLDAGCTAILVLEEGDEMRSDHLACLVGLLQSPHEGKTLAWVYGDSDHHTENGVGRPWLKPAWDPDYFLACDMFTLGAVFSAATLSAALTRLAQTAHAAKAMNEEWDWHPIACAVAEITSNGPSAVGHWPRVGHRRPCRPDAHLHMPEPPRRYEAVNALAQRQARGAQVDTIAAFPGLLRVQWPLPAVLPRVSLIIPTRDHYALLSACIDSLLAHTDYPSLEILVVDNDSRCPMTLAYLATLPEKGVRVLSYPHPFNYSAINNRAVEQATGQFVALINNDIEVPPQETGWLREMVSQALRPGVGAVGAKLLWQNGMVQHGGVVVGVNLLAAHTGNNLRSEDPGYLGHNHCVRRQSSVTAACLLTHKALYQAMGGLDEARFLVTFNDVDFCLRLTKAGYAVIWTPFARLFHRESASRGKDEAKEQAARAHREQIHFRRAWTEHDFDDPYYHPGLSLDYATGPYGGLRMPPPDPQLRLSPPCVAPAFSVCDPSDPPEGFVLSPRSP